MQNQMRPGIYIHVGFKTWILKLDRWTFADSLWNGVLKFTQLCTITHYQNQLIFLLARNSMIWILTILQLHKYTCSFVLKFHCGGFSFTLSSAERTNLYSYISGTIWSKIVSPWAHSYYIVALQEFTTQKKDMDNFSHKSQDLATQYYWYLERLPRTNV